jgi:hypothetical protein
MIVSGDVLGAIDVAQGILRLSRRDAVAGANGIQLSTLAMSGRLALHLFAP